LFAFLPTFRVLPEFLGSSIASLGKYKESSISMTDKYARREHIIVKSQNGM
jgi:hypothetical protein